MQQSAGAEHVINITPVTLAEDFVFCAEKIPGLYCSFCASSNGKFFINEASFKTGIVAFFNLVFDYLSAVVKKKRAKKVLQIAQPQKM